MIRGVGGFLFLLFPLRLVCVICRSLGSNNGASAPLVGLRVFASSPASRPDMERASRGESLASLPNAFANRPSQESAEFLFEAAQMRAWARAVFSDAFCSL